MTPHVTYWVVCASYELGPYRNRLIATRRLADIEEAGNCRDSHIIVEKVSS